MSEGNPARSDCPVSTATLRQRLHDQVDRSADFCETFDGRFLPFEKKLKDHLWEVGKLFIAVFMLARHRRLQDQAPDYPGSRFSECLPRTLRTMFGQVRYWRDYWVRRKGSGGFHPLDAELGLTRDGFSPWVMSLACRLTAYLSYAKTTLILEAFWGWSPSTETVEQWALGVGGQAAAYMASARGRLFFVSPSSNWTTSSWFFCSCTQSVARIMARMKRTTKSSLASAHCRRVAPRPWA